MWSFKKSKKEKIVQKVEMSLYEVKVSETETCRVIAEKCVLDDEDFWLMFFVDGKKTAMFRTWLWWRKIGNDSMGGENERD